MQIFKRAMALALTLVMVFSVIPAGAFALESTTVPKVDENSVTIEGTNGFGNLLSAAISEEQKAAAEAEPEYAAGYGVTGLEIEGNVATATYNALEDAILIVALYSEDGMQMLASGKTAVTPDDTETTVTIEGTMPQYFQASAYLVDSYDFSPLCQAYETPVYTKEMQQLIASNIHDYDAELVLNLDEDENTNFAVYAENVIRVQEVAGKNIVTTCDDENMRYVIENADETFTSLRPGDVVSYAYGENELLLVKVAAITVTGTTVIITGDSGIELEDAFDYLKLEITADNSDLEEIDNTDAAKHSVGAVVPMGDENTDVEVKPIRYEFAGEEKKYFDGYVEVLLNNTMDFYHTLGNTHYEWELSYSITSNFKVEVNNEDDDKQWVIPILKDMRLVNIASFGLTFSPEFVFKASGSFTVNTTFYGSVGISCATGRKPMNISTPMKLTDNLALEGELFVGFDLSPRFYVLHEKVFYIEMGIPVGITASGEISWETENVFEGLAPEIHECTNCIEGEVYLSVSIDVSIKFFNKKNIELGGKITKKFASKPFYWSFDYGEFDWCYCPHKQYLVTVATVDLDGNPVPGVELTLGEMGKTTDESGIAQVYLPAGRNDVTVTYNGQTDSWVLTVKSEPAKMKIILGDQGNGFIFEEENLGSAVDYGEVIASGTCGADGDNLTWELTAGGLLTIAGSGAMMRYSWERGVPWYSYQDSITTVVIKDGVTAIGDYAFYDCDSLNAVTIPDSMTTIGRYAFYGCGGLASVSIPNGVTSIETNAFEGSGLISVTIPKSVSIIEGYTFRNCDSLTSITIPDSVSVIGDSAFRDCDGLTSITIPDSVITIEKLAFHWCHNLTNVTIGKNVTSIGEDAFVACRGITNLTIPDSVKSIGESAFRDCSNLTSIVIPAGLSVIEKNTFEGCTGLTSVVIPGNVTTIGDEAFYECTGLTTVTFMDGVVSVGNSVFSGCINLSSVTLPSTLTTLGYRVFYDCKSLTEIRIPDSVTSLGHSAFYNCQSLTSAKLSKNSTTLPAYAFWNCQKLKDVTIGHKVTSIGDYAFSGCLSLPGITIPDGVTTIGENAFESCYGLLQVTIPDSVTVIGSNAFRSCTSLTGIHIPKSLTTISNGVFQSCTILENVTIPYGVTSIGQYAFSNCTNLNNVTIPDSVTSVGAYAFDGCQSFTSIVIPGSVTSIGAFAFAGCANAVDVTIPNSVTSIGSGAFCNCTSLTSIVIPNSVKSIGNSLLKNCSNLISVKLPDGITTIGDNMFHNCTSLPALTIPDSVTTIGYEAFSHCEKMTHLTIPANVKTIDSFAFSSCINLDEVVFCGNAPIFERNAFYVIVLTAYYPAGNTTWTATKLQNYGGTLTWIPYTLDENGDMIINEAAAVTVEAEQLDVPAEEMAVVQTGLDVPSQDFDEKDETVDPDAVYGGEYGTEITDSYTIKTASFTGLVPGAEYLLLAMKRIDVDDPLTADNLLFIDQAQALADGTLLFTYVQREDTGLSYVVACGASNKNLKDAVITFPEMVADGELQVVEPTVVYDGKTLTEGKDYTITGTASFTEAGTYTCHIRGIHNYSGTVECSYTVKSNVTATAKIISYSTSLGGNIAMNFYVELSDDLVADPDAYIQFSFAGKTVNVPLSEGIPTGTSYRFACPITSKNMTDDITAQVYNGSGPVGDPKTMAVDTYCNWIIANTNDQKTINLMKAMLNYGASAQMLFNYRTDDLANAALADADKVFAKVDASAFAHGRVGEEEGIKPVSYTLLLDSETTVRCYFELTGDKSIDEFTFTVDSEEVTPIYKDGYYYIEKANIAAHRLDDMHVFTCGNITITYGGMSYVNQVMTYYTSGTTFDMASALYAYSKAAEAYIG